MYSKVPRKLNVIAEAQKVKVVWQDITTIYVDVIVNAANGTLLGGGGVDGAIHRAAGPDLLEQCRGLGGCKTGEAKITKAYNIRNVQAIIHTVGPIAKAGVTKKLEEALYDCYTNCLTLAIKNDFRTIAFPTISTGLYAYPKKEAAKVATKAVKDFLEEYNDKIDEVIFAVIVEEDKQIYKELIPNVFK